MNASCNWLYWLYWLGSRATGMACLVLELQHLEAGYCYTTHAYARHPQPEARSAFIFSPGTCRMHMCYGVWTSGRRKLDGAARASSALRRLGPSGLDPRSLVPGVQALPLASTLRCPRSTDPPQTADCRPLPAVRSAHPPRLEPPASSLECPGPPVPRSQLPNCARPGTRRRQCSRLQAPGSSAMVLPRSRATVLQYYSATADPVLRPETTGTTPP